MFCAAPDCHGGVEVPTGELHYGCRLRSKGVAVTSAASPTMRSKPGSRQQAMNSWERGVAGEHRPGGGFMPYSGADGQNIGVKEYAERRHEIDARVKDLKTNPSAAT